MPGGPLVEAGWWRAVPAQVEMVQGSPAFRRPPVPIVAECSAGRTGTAVGVTPEVTAGSKTTGGVSRTTTALPAHQPMRESRRYAAVVGENRRSSGNGVDVTESGRR